MELCNCDIYHAKLGKLTKESLKIVMTDIFNGLIFLRDLKIIHGDLKPENIFLIKEDTFNVVIGDFGLAQINRYDDKMTDFNIQTCWYRSPEVTLHIPYSYEIDAWSACVIMLELIIDYPLFRAKTNETLFYLFIKIIGDNPETMIPKNPELKNFSVMGDLRCNLDHHINKAIQLIKENIFLELEPIVNGLLKWDPKKRISLEECLEHINNL